MAIETTAIPSIRAGFEACASTPSRKSAHANAAMYCPEANVLASRHVDPRSKTPALKCVVVSVKPDGLAIAA